MCIISYAHIYMSSFARRRAGPNAGCGLMLGGARCRAVPDVARLGPMYVICDYAIMFMVCASLGRLTKLHSYSFQCWFQVLLIAGGRA